MTIQQLKYVIKIVECGSITEAAKQLCAISTQHYAFAVNAFVNLIERLDSDEYEFTLRETRTYEIIEDVANLRSEVGILYFSQFNEKGLKKLLKESHLAFTPLFDAAPTCLSAPPTRWQAETRSPWRI